jgi:hypothetical protein
VETGIYTPQEYLAQREALTAQAAAVRDQLTALQRPKPRPLPRETVARTIDAYPRAETPAQKNALLKSILDHAVYTKKERSRPGGPQTFSLDLFPKLGQRNN